MKQKLVTLSIVVPVYQVEKTLWRCVNSLFAQTFRDYELILVDDGSPDNCPRMCDEIASTAKEPVRVIHKPNGGLSSARLAGFKEAKGEYIIFIDSDDYVAPSMMEKLYAACVSTDSSFAICSYTKVQNEKEEPFDLPVKQSVIEKNELNESYLLPIIGKLGRSADISLPGFIWLRLFKKKLLRETDFVSERIYFTEDDLMNLLIADRTERIAVVNEPLYYYWQNPQSLTNSYRKGTWQMIKNRQKFCEDYCLSRHIVDSSGQRLHYSLFNTLSFSVRNACKLSDYKAYKMELIVIRAEECVDRLFKLIDCSYMSKGQKIFYYLYKIGSLRLIYYYYRWRLNY